MDRKFLKTYFFCVIGTLLLAFLLWKWRDIAAFSGVLLRAFRPVLFGVVFAALLSRPFALLTKLFRWSFPKAGERVWKGVAIVTLYLLLGGVIATVLTVVIPQLYHSLERLFSGAQGYYATLTRMAERLLSFGGKNWWTELSLDQRLQELLDGLPALARQVMGRVTKTVTDLIQIGIDSSVGAVLSVYALLQKKRLFAQAKRLLRAVVGSRAEQPIVSFCRLFSRTFANFFSGQLTEAVILGVLCFLGMLLFGFDYALLISVITAVSNLVPIVGPILGAIPCGLLLFLVEPRQAIWFLVFLVALQQVEANLIYPRVVGGSVGLPAVWVLLSVTVGGSLFGIGGMIFAIPTVSVIYQLLGRFVRARTRPDPPDDGRSELEVFSDDSAPPKKGRI